MYAVELATGIWIAPWSGDPGRTLISFNAKTYKTKRGAKIALGLSRRYRPFINAKIVPADLDGKVTILRNGGRVNENK